MKKILISVILGISSVVSSSIASEFPTAAEIKAISVEATKKLETELFNSEKGKKAYSEIMTTLENKINYYTLLCKIWEEVKYGC